MEMSGLDWSSWRSWDARQLGDALASLTGHDRLGRPLAESAPRAVPGPDGRLQVAPPEVSNQLAVDDRVVLMVTAQPSGTDPLALDEEYRLIQRQLESGEAGRAFDLHVRLATRADDLWYAVAAETPTVVHFSGHGELGGIAMIDDKTGGPQLVPGESLAALFAVPFVRQQLRMVVLNACLSLAQAIPISQAIDGVVIGMSDYIGDAAAIAFADGLWLGLSQGMDSSSAFELAKSKIDLAGWPEAHKPQLIARPGLNPAAISLVS